MINGKPIGGINHPQVKLGDEIREALKDIVDIISVNYDVDYINDVRDLYIDIKIYIIFLKQKVKIKMKIN